MGIKAIMYADIYDSRLDPPPEFCVPEAVEDAAAQCCTDWRAYRKAKNAIKRLECESDCTPESETEYQAAVELVNEIETEIVNYDERLTIKNVEDYL